MGEPYLVLEYIGTVAFAVSGGAVAIRAGMDWLGVAVLAAGVSGPVAVLMGVVTGTGGGVARDVLARQRPLILVGQIYALSAAAGATVLVILTDAHAPAEVARWAAFAIVLVLRLLAIRYSWSLPRIPRTSGQPEANS